MLLDFCIGQVWLFFDDAGITDISDSVEQRIELLHADSYTLDIIIGFLKNVDHVDEAGILLIIAKTNVVLLLLVVGDGECSRRIHIV